MAGKGGKRPGLGRPKGSLNKKTLERKAISDAVNQRIMKQADALFNAQLALAVGSVMIYRVEETTGSKGQTKRENILVTDPHEIKDVLDGIGDGCGIVGEDYYFVSAVLPNNMALDSMLNRGIGKPIDRQEVSTTTNVDAIVQGVIDRLTERGWSQEKARTFAEQRYPEVSTAIH